MGRVGSYTGVLHLSSVSYVNPFHLYLAMFPLLEVKCLRKKLRVLTTLYCKSLADITRKMTDRKCQKAKSIRALDVGEDGDMM